jgi:membrane-bound metal-dependent hydrolase YbcI (DUF457 family)
MLIGHFAVGFAAKKLAPQASLGTIFLAAQLIDVICPVLMLAGVERVEIAPGDTAVTPLAFVHFPYSHSLVMTLVWAVLFGGVYWCVRGTLAAAAWLGIAVASHWVLDAIAHRPDLPLYPGDSPLIGFGLWNSVTGTVLVEGAMFVAGLMLYLKCTRARNRIGSYALWALAAVLALFYAAAIFGPPPPSPQAVAITGVLGIGLSIAWGCWIERHRAMTQASMLGTQF